MSLSIHTQPFFLIDVVPQRDASGLFYAQTAKVVKAQDLYIEKAKKGKMWGKIPAVLLQHQQGSQVPCLFPDIQRGPGPGITGVSVHPATQLLLTLVPGAPD